MNLHKYVDKVSILTRKIHIFFARTIMSFRIRGRISCDSSSLLRSPFLAWTETISVMRPLSNLLETSRIEIFLNDALPSYRMAQSSPRRMGDFFLFVKITCGVRVEENTVSAR
jgi:hypothetical protein